MGFFGRFPQKRAIKNWKQLAALTPNVSAAKKISIFSSNLPVVCLVFLKTVIMTHSLPPLPSASGLSHPPVWWWISLVPAIGTFPPLPITWSPHPPAPHSLIETHLFLINPGVHTHAASPPSHCRLPDHIVPPQCSCSFCSVLSAWLFAVSAC